MPRSDLRQTIRQQRRQLSGTDRAEAAAMAAIGVSRWPLFRKARKIAAYIAFDGELDPAPLVDLARNSGKQIYLPVLARNHNMRFALFTEETALQVNAFGIAEPVPSQRLFVPARSLDIVMTPLVAFDRSGNRMGMGSGFYDRCFAFLRHRKSWFKPAMLGLGYSFQQVETLEAREWDVPLQAIATERGLVLPKKIRVS